MHFSALQQVQTFVDDSNGTGTVAMQESETEQEHKDNDVTVEHALEEEDQTRRTQQMRECASTPQSAYKENTQIGFSIHTYSQVRIRLSYFYLHMVDTHLV